MGTNIHDLNRKQIFIRDAMPDSWLEYAEELEDAAELLWQQEKTSLRIGVVMNAENEVRDSFNASGISRPYILLAAFAVENLLKGLLVLQNPAHSTTGKLSDEIWGHDIVGLAKKIRGLKLSTAEKSFCKIAADALPYWGRYPVPKKFQALKKEVVADQQFRDTFLKLHYRLGKMIYDAIKNGWDSGAGPQIIKFRSARYGDTIEPGELLKQ